VEYNPSGGVLWGQQISGARASVQSMTLNSQDELLLSGLFTEDVILGNLTLSNFDGYHNYIANLQTDVFTTAGKDLKVPELKVFPNPARDMICIVNPGLDNLVNYVIFSATGRHVISGTMNAGNNIDISHLPAGQYLLRLTDSDENSIRSCIVIKQ
jgi:hypothetical protein